MASNSPSVYCEIAHRMIGIADDFSLEDQRAFWEYRYNSAESVVANRIGGKGEKAISDTILFGYIEYLIVMLGDEGVVPFASFVIEHILQYVKSEFAGFTKSHERAESFFAENWDTSKCDFNNSLWIIADWMNHELLKEPNAIARNTFIRRLKQLKVRCFCVLEEYLATNDKPEI